MTEKEQTHSIETPIDSVNLNAAHDLIYSLSPFSLA
jgi:hypothetical protein